MTIREDKDSDKEEEEIQEIVFVHSADTVAVANVTTGVQDDDYIQVKSGLTEGDKIVIGPYAAISRKLEEGKKVYIKKDEKDKKEENK